MEKEKKEHSGMTMGKIMMNQIDRSGDRSAVWMVSSLSKLLSADPQMNLICLMNIIKKEMPTSFKNYQEYLKYT